MKRNLLISVLLCSAIILIGAQTGFAWPTYEDGCQACHGSGFGTPLHTIHTAQACTICHPGAAGALPIPTSNCLGCHTPNATNACPLIETSHGNPPSCLACHTDCTNSQPPANDDCENATTIAILPFTAFSNTARRRLLQTTQRTAMEPTQAYGINSLPSRTSGFKLTLHPATTTPSCLCMREHVAIST
jgi:hypothetical protein